MCLKCKEAVQKHYPDFTPEQAHSILWGATCFPFGGPEDVDLQLADLKANTDGTLEGALCYADAALRTAMESGE